MESPKKAWVTGIDQIWLINLARRRDRLDRFLQAQPEMNGRINFLPAYDGKNLKLTPSLARLFAPNNFDWHKPTMGCALSHLSLWQRLAVEPNPSASYLILEDDARLEPSWVRKVEEAFLSGSVPADYEVLYLGGILPQYRESFERNVQPVNQLVARVHPDCRFGNNPSGYFHFCAYSYILSQRGARRLLDLLQFWNGYWLQADFVAAYHTPDLSPHRRIYFFHPLIAESFQDTQQGLARPYDENQSQENKVDSDIWKNDDRFGPDEIAAIKTNGLPLDIPAALGWVSDDPLSLSASALRELAADSAPVASSDSTTKKVGLICVTRNNSSKLRTTLNSIIRHTKLESYDLYVIDNASSEEHTRIYGEILADHIKVVRSDKNLHWVGGINLGLEVTKNYRYVAFLNDDIEVGPGWLENLADILDCNEDVGAVGPMTSNDRDWQGYDRVLKAFPAWKAPALEEIDRNDVLSMNEKIQGNDPLIRIGTGMLAFFCILLRREVIDLVGSLDSDFTELYTCDDDDYCDRIQCAGYTLALSTNTYVAHYSGTSSTKIDAFSEKTKSSIELLNRKKAERRRSVQCSPENVNASGLPKKAGLICVTRNSADKLKVTLDSIVKHTDPALFDLYLVDNGSTDSTAELCEGTWPPNIHFIRKNENLGWVGGINSCLPQAKKYPFVGFLNDDIEVGPLWLEHLVNLIEWNKTVGAVGPLTSNERDWQGYDRFRLGPVKPGLPELEGIDRQDAVQMARAMASFNPGVTLNDCVLAFFCVLIRAEIVEKLGPLDEAFNELYLGDDEDYCKRILATGHLLALSFNAYVAHHSGSRSLAVKDYESRYQKAHQIISEKTAKGAYTRKQLANKSAAMPHLAAEGDLVPQNLGHMVCEGHLGGFFSEGDGGTYYPLMWAHLVRKHGIRSVLDVGCGRGYSALYFKSLGCDIKGIDGSQEAQATNLLGEDFVLADYAVAPSSIQTEFDLVWSCEFVEHVEERFMKNYLRDFRRGRFLAMTFAGPGQPGHHHVNCRPAEYWIRIMYSQGFDYLPEETAELREYARRDMEKNDSESDKRFVYHFMYRGLFFKNTRTCSGGL
jgi:GT2 family glycosyltransferase/GR25 family glycosyltransferase involved in LPS biosynthesis